MRPSAVSVIFVTTTVVEYPDRPHNGGRTPRLATIRAALSSPSEKSPPDELAQEATAAAWHQQHVEISDRFEHFQGGAVDTDNSFVQVDCNDRFDHAGEYCFELVALVEYGIDLFIQLLGHLVHGPGQGCYLPGDGFPLVHQHSLAEIAPGVMFRTRRHFLERPADVPGQDESNAE